MKFLFCFAVALTLYCPQASAQGYKYPIFDVRARSRQAGQGIHFQQPVQQRPATVPQGQYQPQPKFQNQDQAAMANAQAPANGAPETAAGEQGGGLKQSGIKLFRDEDADKVMNFEVNNPEFDKLSDKKKQDVMNRIKIEMN